MSALARLLTPRLTELGKIKIGTKDATERQSRGGGTWRAPVKLDHFLVTTTHRDAKGDLVVDDLLMRTLAEDCGSADGKVREIPIVVLSDDPDEIMSSAYTRYKGKAATGRCDGDVVTWYAKDDGTRVDPPVQRPCDGEHLHETWKLHTVFSCVIACGDARLGGVYRFRTTSRITAEQMYGSLLHIGTLTGGVLQGLPLRLVVRPIQVSPDGKPTTVYVVHVELRGADVNEIQRQAVQLAQMRRDNALAVRAARREYVAMLRAPGVDESDVEQADVAEEFHPPSDVTVTPAEPARLTEALLADEP